MRPASGHFLTIFPRRALPTCTSISNSRMRLSAITKANFRKHPRDLNAGGPHCRRRCLLARICSGIAHPGKQTGIGSSPQEILASLPAIVVDDAANSALRNSHVTPLPSGPAQRLSQRPSPKANSSSNSQQSAVDYSHPPCWSASARWGNDERSPPRTAVR